MKIVYQIVVFNKDLQIVIQLQCMTYDVYAVGKNIKLFRLRIKQFFLCGCFHIMKNEADIRIVLVRELGPNNRISRTELMRYRSGMPITVSLSTRFVIPPDADNRVCVVMTAVYHVVRGLIRRSLLNYSVEVVFEVGDINEVLEFTGDRISLPLPLLKVMLSTTVGTLRGMLASRTSRTVLHNHPLPILNVSELVSSLAYGSPVKSVRPMVDYIYE